MLPLSLFYEISGVHNAAAYTILNAGVNKLWCFYGQMGAGKTTLIKEICAQLGAKDHVSSPTFSLVNEYALANGEKIFHFDFYRINSIEEVYDIGFEDYFYNGNICLVEWPEKIETLLISEEIYTIKILGEEDGRKLILS